MNLTWRKTGKRDLPAAEALLRRLEPFCVNACSRFIRREAPDRLWALSGDGAVSALLIHSRHSLFPLLNGNRDLPVPRFLNRFPGRASIHSLQGIREDVELFEAILDRTGFRLSEKLDYDLMSLDEAPRRTALTAGPGGLVLRQAGIQDREALFPLQAAYEQEEVLPQDASFDPAACRLSLEHIVRREQILGAELDRRLVGKINTNAESFTRFQIGGVYVLPGCRSRGIATRMAASLSARLLAQGKNISLFVKKQNPAARAVYEKIGFKVIGNYRICYYS
ncbi:MAG: GNAT family N-acetyltransferase [Treponema sp.]|jgi:ribosomal protein S18 acetylase RimI-like enzyme|nr:GNAT family N-acetyltransferase [Treponema sp.]